jgi:hypothetical protein
MTLHTSPGCQIGSDTTQFSGTVTTGNCDVAAKGQSKNVGCSIESASKQSYGAGLNQNGGGVFATQWNSDGINIYFFPRGAIPEDVLTADPIPSSWGKPAARFSGACDIDKMFGEQQIVIDTTFCGVWAGAVWEDGSCAKKAKTCEEYVRDNPEAFKEAYWDIKGLRVYQDDGKAPVSAPSVPAIPSKSIAISVSVPVPTIKPSLPAIPLPASSRVIYSASSSPRISGVPAKPTTAPAAPLLSSVATIPGLPSRPVAAPDILLPSSVAAAPGLPSISASAPAAVLPSSVAAAPVVPTPVPQSSQTQNGTKPSRTIQSQVNAPTGANGMPGWNWPVAGDIPSGDKPNGTVPVASPPKGSGVPAQNTSGAVTAPTSKAAVVQPSNAPATPSDAPLVAPVAPAAPVITIYETVYMTVPPSAAATPAPDAKKARAARHIKEHRRRWTKHNARL